MLALLISCASTGDAKPEVSVPVEAKAIEEIDWAGSIALDWSSSTIKEHVTVKSFVDGDTTHFHVPETLLADGVIKARYIAVNTPESTGKIEEYIIHVALEAALLISFKNFSCVFTT